MRSRGQGPGTCGSRETSSPAATGTLTEGPLRVGSNGLRVASPGPTQGLNHHEIMNGTVRLSAETTVPQQEALKEAAITAVSPGDIREGFPGEHHREVDPGASDACLPEQVVPGAYPALVAGGRWVEDTTAEASVEVMV